MKCSECLKNYDYANQCPSMSEAEKAEAFHFGDKLCRSHRLIKDVKDAKVTWYGNR